MARSALQAYETATKTTTSSRQMEASILFKAARQLQACTNDWDAQDAAARLREALRYNQRLWTVFQSALTRPDHPMDAQMRLNLLTISAFVDRRTFELLARPERDKVQALIDINRNLASGLSTKAAAATQG